MRSTTGMKGNDVVETLQYGATGTDHELQQLITDFLHRRVMENGTCTLAQLGYLNMNTVSYVEDHVEVKLYFHAGLATDVTKLSNGREIRSPKNELMMFHKYLFIGSLQDAVAYDTIPVPKYYIDRDDLGKPTLQFRTNTKKIKENTSVLVLRCNLVLTMAAALNLNLMDPNYKVTYDTLGSSNKKNKDNHIVITVGNRQEYPVKVTVQCTSDSMHYFDPELTYPFIESRIAKNRQAMQNRKLVQKNVSEKAEKLQKNQKDFAGKNFKKMR